MTTAANGKASKSRSTFRMEVGVTTTINAKPETIWSLLTNAQDFPRWNSTVQSIDGSIAPGETIQLKVPVAPDRVFKLKVTEFTPNKAMVWQDGAAPMFKGIRRYTL